MFKLAYLVNVLAATVLMVNGFFGWAVATIVIGVPVIWFLSLWLPLWLPHVFYRNSSAKTK